MWGKWEKLSSLAGSAILAGEQSVPRKSEKVDPMFHHLFTLGKCVYLFRIDSLDAGSFRQCSSAQIGKSFENLNHQFGDLTWVFFPQQRPKLSI